MELELKTSYFLFVCLIWGLGSLDVYMEVCTVIHNLLVGRKREEINVLVSHYCCRLTGRATSHHTVGLQYFGSVKNFTKFDSHQLLVGRKREEIDVLASHYYHDNYVLQ